MTATATRPPKLPPAWFQHLFWRGHRVLYKLSGGRFLWTTSSKRGWGALRLTTLGRKSGQQRSVIVGYIEDGPNLVVLAMNGWDEGHPVLVAQPRGAPRCHRSFGAPAGPPRPRVCGRGDEHDRLWQRWAEVDEGLDGYAGLRSIETPVVVLEPARQPTDVHAEVPAWTGYAAAIAAAEVGSPFRLFALVAGAGQRITRAVSLSE